LAAELVPGLKRVAVIFADSERAAILEANRTAAAGQRLGVRTKLFSFRDEPSLENALSTIHKERPPLLLAVDSPMTVTHRKRLASFATGAGIPLVSESRAFAEAGAVLTYGPSARDVFGRAATYVDRILKGAHPSEMPIEQPSKFHLLLNLKTAAAIGLQIPEAVLLRADETIDDSTR
jgi:putative ABC transport system substrate-binding protein